MLWLHNSHTELLMIFLCSLYTSSWLCFALGYVTMYCFSYIFWSTFLAQLFCFKLVFTGGGGTLWCPRILQDSLWKSGNISSGTLKPAPGSIVFVHRNACLVSCLNFVLNVTQVCVHCMHTLHSWCQMFWHNALCLIFNKPLYPLQKFYVLK
jgi:hypothetical protein